MTKSIYYISFLLLISISLFAQDQIDHVKAFEQITVVNGGWFHSSDQGDVVEEWTQADEQTIRCRNYRIRITDGDTASEKTATLTLRTDGVYYTTKFRAINNNQSIDYKLVETEELAGAMAFTFENANFEYPKRVIYSIEANRAMRIKYEGERNGKPRSEETVYDREFSAAETELYVRFGLGAFQMKTNGFFFRDRDNVEPTYQAAPSWELGAQLVFKGRGNFIRLGLEVGLAGRYSKLNKSSYSVNDTLVYERSNVRYNQTRVFLSFTPELRLDKNDKVTIFVGPYISQGLITRTKGLITPSVDPSVTRYNANYDLKKTDFGLILGTNMRLNPWKTELGGRLGLRAWLGLNNLDALYTVGCTQCTGEVTQRGFSVSYAINLLKS
jgi:hypothetical protein